MAEELQESEVNVAEQLKEQLKENERLKSLSTAGLWCGVAGLILSFIPALNFFVASILGILAIVFGTLASKGDSFRTAGVILGAITLAILVIWFIAFIVFGVLFSVDPDTF